MPINSGGYLSAVRASLFNGHMGAKQAEGQNLIISEWGARDRRQLAYVLATTFHETDRTMQPIYERGARSYFDKYEPGTKIGKMLGNTRKGDGYLFRGRGFVQLTGRTNYARMGKRIGVDLELSPDSALDPRIAVQCLVIGMTEGLFTGKKLSTYITASRADYFNARRVVNGTDRAGLIAGYAEKFEAALHDAEKPVAATIPAAVPVPEDKPAPELAAVLMVGSRGPRVTALQQELARLNYHPGGTDGIFGNLTRDAVLAFQADNSLKTDGMAGEQTWAALRVAKPRPLMAERTDATLSDLADKGSTIADGAVKSKKGAWAAIVAGVTTAGAKVSEHASDIANLPVEPFRYAFEQYGPYLFGATIVVAGVFLFYQSRKVGAARVADHRDAKTL